ncbi:unnamed protein product [Rotaria sordida]|uniref:Uncharacterized protein n=1 Tax=Rotaria sordida TaxID=392033 RepID=A0A814J2G5_9BILA|nr:unnamed protein product [Rotaria sordida]CAF1032510.1 unnamed protein product [Rotaria sordida]CAF3587388.1 unnamed protein product [Rotaria sordida]CAF3775986.1 unnamed protein product [Rotaria sordida]
MVKQNSYSYNDRDMNQYKMRTPYGGHANNYQQSPSKNNRVPVAKSSGCCCCGKKKSNNIAPRPTVVQSQPHQLTAHEKAHLRIDPNDPFYHRHGRINKNQNRTKNSSQQKHVKNKSHPTVQTTYVRQSNQNSNHPVHSTVPKTKKQSSCCTIL